jgi:hypothetical protein
MQHPNVRNIAIDIVLTLLTCGLFNIYVQYKQCGYVNDMLKQPKYSFLFWVLFCLITCGLYHIYHEYRKSCDIAVLLKKDPGSAGLISVILTLFGLWMINDAIQQADINTYYGSSQL